MVVYHVCSNNEPRSQNCPALYQVLQENLQKSPLKPLGPEQGIAIWHVAQLMVHHQVSSYYDTRAQNALALELISFSKEYL